MTDRIKVRHRGFLVEVWRYRDGTGAWRQGWAALRDRDGWPAADGVCGDGLSVLARVEQLRARIDAALLDPDPFGEQARRRNEARPRRQQERLAA